jgi:hypothetical protein
MWTETFTLLLPVSIFQEKSHFGLADLPISDTIQMYTPPTASTVGQQGRHKGGLSFFLT